MADKMDIYTNLSNLGLTQEESIVYLELVRDGVSTVLQLSKRVNIPRTTMYRLCEELVNKGFAEWIVEENGKSVRAVHTDKLRHVVEQKRAELIKAENSLSNLQKSLKENIQKLPKTQVRYYQGVQGIKQIIWNCLDAEKEVIGYSEFGRRNIVGGNFYDSYVKEFKLRKLKDRAIGNENCLKYVDGYVKDEKHQQKIDDIRIIPKEIFYVTGDTSIYNNVYAVCYWNQNEVVGVEIENAELVKLHKSIFEILWKISQPIKP